MTSPAHAQLGVTLRTQRLRSASVSMEDPTPEILKTRSFESPKSIELEPLREKAMGSVLAGCNSDSDLGTRRWDSQESCLRQVCGNAA